MFEFINKLRQKSRSVRIIIMWAGVCLCMIVVFAVWVWSMKSMAMSLKKNNKDQDKILTGIKQFKNDMPTLWGSLGAGVQNVLTPIQSEVPKILHSPIPSVSKYQDWKSDGQDGLPLE